MLQSQICVAGSSENLQSLMQVTRRHALNCHANRHRALSNNSCSRCCEVYSAVPVGTPTVTKPRSAAGVAESLKGRRSLSRRSRSAGLKVRPLSATARDLWGCQSSPMLASAVMICCTCVSASSSNSGPSLAFISSRKDVWGAVAVWPPVSVALAQCSGAG